MIEETAIVTEKFDAQVSLEIERRTACGICGQTRGCGNATWGKMLGHQQGVVKANNPMDVNVGDRVIVGIEESVFLNATFLLYVVPLITLFTGAGLAQLIFNQDAMVILGAVFGLVLGFFGVKKLSNTSYQQRLIRPYAVILRRSNETNSINPS